MSKLTIIILNFNTCALTLRAVKSVLNAGDDLRVVVVDNSSTDESVEMLEKLAKSEARLSVIARDKNDGFAAGNNVALKWVKTPYCMLLNSDAYLDAESSIADAIEYMNSHSEVGMLTPKVVLGNGTLDPASHRGFPTPWNAFTYFSGLEKLSSLLPFLGGYHQTWKNLSVVHEIDACSGAAMIIRTSAMEKVGLLDEQFFMYGEDLDWCFRFKMAGWKIVFYPNLLVHHDKHTSGIKKTEKSGLSNATSEIQLKSRSAFYEAMRLFYNKHYSKVYPPWVRHTMFAGIELVRKIRKH